MAYSMQKKQKQKQSNFAKALTITLSNDGWILPESHALRVMDEHIKRLEAEIDVLTGGRSSKPPRINPMEERKIPS